MFEQITVEGIKADLTANLEANGWAVTEGSIGDLLIAPMAAKLYDVYHSLDALEDIFYVSKDSGPYLDRMAATYGVIRKPGVKAVCSIVLTGTPGTCIPNGMAFQTPDGRKVSNLDTGATIPASGSITISATAAEPGASYNVAEGALTDTQVTIPGLTDWYNTEATGGIDEESDESLAGRFYETLRRPATSGNAYAYEQWANSTTGVGVSKAKPLARGPGTVDVLIAGANRDPVEQAVVDDTAAYIETVRPVGADVLVQSVEGVSVNVTATVELDGTAPLSAVQTAYTDRLRTYLESIALIADKVSYNRCLYLLLDTPGINDFSTLTINGGTADIPLEEHQVPTLGTVEVTPNA